ncbi:hypothetical protein BD779DRAFT_1474774 [Infundibulicybe gibba]|nr:hypothetical protein BD779DRAFT_1474774 [Infundibulicybe gibba]
MCVREAEVSLSKRWRSISEVPGNYGYRLLFIRGTEDGVGGARRYFVGKQPKIFLNVLHFKIRGTWGGHIVARQRGIGLCPKAFKSPTLCDTTTVYSCPFTYRTHSFVKGLKVDEKKDENILVERRGYPAPGIRNARKQIVISHPWRWAGPTGRANVW